MNIGMLWLDDDRHRSLEEKVDRAVAYYQEKYGRMPEMCLVNAQMVEDAKLIGTISVQPTINILPHHFWLGMKPA